MQGTKRSRTHADEFRNLEDRAPKDYDPEDEHLGADSDAGSSGSDLPTKDEFAARQHYDAVGKSRLRRHRDPATLGPQYAGNRISRKGVDAEQDEYDPLAAYGSDEESDVDMPAEDTSGEDVEPDEDSEEDGSMEDEDGEDDDSATDVTDVSNDEHTDGAAQTVKDDRAALRRLVQEQNNVTATITQATQQDADKGRAVKRQRKTFDSILNARIRLQQGLSVFNTLPKDFFQEADQDALAAAESAAINLWNTLESLRQVLASPTPNANRMDADTSTSTAALWSHMQESEAHSKRARDATLTKWSRRTTPANAQLQQAANSRRLNPSATSQGQTPITSILAEHLSVTNLPRLIARTQTNATPLPSSSLPTTDHSSRNIETTKTDPATYEDADFYATLLKELLAQREQDALSATATAGHNGTSTSTDLTSEVKSQHQAARQATKARKNIDTKASKGRKLRYTVHEKLLNFMAPVECGDWGHRQREELFASLLGRRPQNIDGDGIVENDEMDVDGGEEAALNLFRN